MTFDEYEESVMPMAVYPHRGTNVSYPALGLCGEAGEVAEKVKKVMRDHGGAMDDHMREAIARELGDVMWYVTAMANELGLSLEAVAKINVAKLKDRQKRGVLGGSGDCR
jgi:NTP pyrophosphatase (non-canonical NTP hydrolase)